MDPADRVQYLPGVGPRRAELLRKLGIATVWDLLWHIPRTWLDRSALTPIGELQPGASQTSVGTILEIGIVGPPGPRARVEGLIGDGPNRARVVWFNNPYLTRTLKPGRRILLSGQTRGPRERVQFVHPEFDLLDEEGRGPLAGGRIVPVYPLTGGVTQKMLRRWIRSALDLIGPRLRDPVPPAVLARLDMPDLVWALQRVHYPEAVGEGTRARDRLAFDEFLTLQLAYGLVKRIQQRPGTARPLRGDGRLRARLLSALPFRLTEGQEKVLGEILDDLGCDRPMNRLLQGDVGSGKTVVAALACLAAAEAGAQSAYLAPTEILATQQAELLARWFGPLGVGTGLLLGRTRAAERRALLERLAAGEVATVIGTHALLEDPVEFRRLGLVVVDEQHRFGVAQRARLRQKGDWPHTLVMSATPIPRTLNLTVYGDLDISFLRQMPAGRRPPRTRIVEENRRDDMLVWVGKRLRRGDRAFFVYPLVEESEQLDLRDATRMAESLRRHPALQGVPVGLLHGRMKGPEKEDVVNAFREGRTPCLVTTTVVEVGVDVPQATIMVVEHPERFGLSQLHQLRGRVGRGGGESWFFLMNRPGGDPEGTGRLRVLVREHDGFRVAEADLRLRGPGDILGTAQHGVPELRVGDLVHDPILHVQAREEADRILKEDPTLSHAEHALLREHVLRRYGERMPLYEVI